MSLLLDYPSIGLLTFFTIPPALFLLFKHRQWLYSYIYWAVIGLLSLCTVSFVSSMTGFALLVNATSLVIASVLGVPGVVGLILMNMIW